MPNKEGERIRLRSNVHIIPLLKWYNQAQATILRIQKLINQETSCANLGIQNEN